ncbi:hypothetical protein TNCT_338461 [Trichonephila clavata]|uniref:Uncharacterized protein n=1 Tax=Trichonephila clavata TaxID=2740835 RepID=A0A8X6HMD1_TRICU|nr:hypothetical protein TNCT_338461 [Trichonephila clavata]
MSVQRFLQLEDVLEPLNSLDSDKNDVEIIVLPPDVGELTDKNKEEENKVNTCEIILNDIPLGLWVLELQTVSSLNRTGSSVSTAKSGKRLKDSSHLR